MACLAFSLSKILSALVSLTEIPVVFSRPLLNAHHISSNYLAYENIARSMALLLDYLYQLIQHTIFKRRSGTTPDLKASMTLPGKFVDVNKMENFLNEQFGDAYRVKVRASCSSLINRTIH